MINVIIISVGINAVYQLNDLRINRNNLLKNLEIKIEQTSKLLSSVNSGPIFYYDIPLIEANITSFLNDPQIKSIFIFELSGEINIFKENSVISGKDLIKVSTDVYYENEMVGTIITNYTRDPINIEIKAYVLNSIITLIATSVLIFAFLIFLLRKIMRPIEELTDLTYEISNGNLDKEINIFSNDEIGKLARSFTWMRDSIKQQISFLEIENEERKKAELELADANRELKTHRNNLEGLVVTRTFELQESVSHLESTQTKLIESEKMAALGNLVAGIAHEINTPVGIGVTAASHLENETKTFLVAYEKNEVSRSILENFVSTVEQSSKMILSNMVRAGNLIQSFKRVAVDQASEEIRPFMLKEYIDEVFMSINSKFKHTDIEIITECDEDFSVTSYPGALSQIITNLSINSLIHGFEEASSGTITVKMYKDEDNAIIHYSDTGCGISKENVKQLFEPFFTTKRGRGGSGLGMHIVYNLAFQTLKGSIECFSEPGEGTTFNIVFPATIQEDGNE